MYRRTVKFSRFAKGPKSEQKSVNELPMVTRKFSSLPNESGKWTAALKQNVSRSAQNEIKFKMQQAARRMKNDFEQENEENDEDDTEFIPFVVKKHTPEYFAKMCTQLGNEGKIAECVAVLEKRMKEDRVRPEKVNFSAVIHVLGKAGQPRKAFEIFKKMRRMWFVPGPGTITSMINACANAHPSEADYSMQQTKWLLQRERHRYGGIHKVTYFAAMKCFAKHGDVAEVFKLADDMIRDGYLTDRQMFESLFSACKCDRESGFKLALDVWRAMISSKVRPSIKGYSLLLKVCRDCGVGEKGNELLKQIIENNKKDVRLRLKRAAPSPNDLKGLIPHEFHTPALRSNGENSLAMQNENFDADNERGLKLAMLGGPDGLLEHMRQNGVTPNVVTLCNIMYLTSYSQDIENKLLDYAKSNHVQLDVEFFNTLIKRFCSKNDSENALKLLDEMTKLRLQPDLRTFTGLSFMCKTHKQGMTLLRDMETYGIKPTLKIFESLLKAALGRSNFEYGRTVLSQMKKHDVKPDVAMLRFIESGLENARTLIRQIELGENVEWNVFGYKGFLTFYKEWTKNLDVHFEIDPKLTVLDKKIETDDLREDWEKPWTVDDEKRKLEKQMGKFKVVP